MANKTVIPEEIPRTTGTINTSHNAANIGDQTAEHINATGNSISGRTMTGPESLQGQEIATEQKEKELRENSGKH